MPGRQLRAQPRGQFGHHLRAQRRHRGEVNAGVDGAGVVAVRGRHAGLRDAQRQRMAFVTQRVVAHGGQPGGRQGVQCLRVQQGEIGVPRQRLAPAEVAVDEPLHDAGGEELALAVLDHRRARFAVVLGDGVDEAQRARRDRAGGTQRRHGGELRAALSPASAMRDGSAPSSRACAATQRSAQATSSTAAGKGCSGASR